MLKISKILILILVLGGMLVFAQEQKIPEEAAPQGLLAAPQSFDRVDRNKNKILDDLEGLIGPAAAGDRFDVIVMLSQSLDLLSLIKSRHGNFSEKFTYPAINGFAANLTKGQIITFSKDADVKQIEFDAPVYPHLDTSQQWFGTTKARTDFGVDGNVDGLASYSKDDIVIAILDTGIDAAHVDLDGGKVIAWHDFTPNNQQTPYDETGACSGHGTHVSSIAAGEGQGNAAFKGVAPGASLVGLKVLRKQFGGCSGDTSWIDAAIQWLIDNKTTYGIEVANMSLGIAGCSDGTDSTSVLVNSAVDAGIVMTVSAGNEGPGTCTIGSPAAAEKAITVGAMADVAPGTKSGSLSGWGFYQAYFSSRGLTADGRLKPDISSPGVFINAASAGTSNGYQQLSGTSMSSPFTAGAAALMLDANSALTTTQVKSIIEASALDWGLTGKDQDYGAGRLQGYEAVKSAGGLTGTNVATPPHTHLTGTVATSGGFDEKIIQVNNVSVPLAVTMIIPSWSAGSPDLDLEIRDGAGNPLFSCTGGPSSASPCTCTTDANGICKSRSVRRQETVGFQPSSTGNYKIRVVSFSGSGDYFLDVSAGTAPAVSITLSTDGAVNFGILPLNSTKDTTAGGVNDVQTVSVVVGPANLDVKSTVFSDGANTWNLGSVNGINQVKWEFSPNAASWNTFLTPNTLFNLANNVAQGASQNLYLRITMPTQSSSSAQHGSTITIMATAP